MKSSKQIADYVFKKRDEHEERKKIIAVRIRRTTYVCSTLCAAVLIVIGINALKPTMDEVPNMIEPITTETTVVPDPFENTENSNASESLQTDASEPNQNNTDASEQTTTESNIFSDASSTVIDIFINPDKHEIITGTNISTGTITKPASQSGVNPSKPTFTTSRTYGPTIPGHTTTVTTNDSDGKNTMVTTTVPRYTVSTIATTTEELFPMPTPPPISTEPPEVFKPTATANGTSQSSTQTRLSVGVSVSATATIVVMVTTTDNTSWEALPLPVRFDNFTYNGSKYAYSNATVSSNHINKLQATITISAVDYDGNTHYETIEIYSIKNVSSAFAVRFSGTHSYLRYGKQ